MASITSTTSSRILPPELRPYPIVVRGEGVWLFDADGNRYLDAMSGGSMAATLGLGRRDLPEIARRQAEQISFVHNERLTNQAQEQLARELVAVAPPGFGRVKFVTGGAEANETAIRLARSYHVERGEPQRWQVISPAQAYHGPTFETLALTGRPGLQGPLAPYLARHLHIPPATHRFDPSGEAALDALDRALEVAGPENVSAFFCEPISAAALPAYTPPPRFWEGLDERRRQHGFLVLFDEVVTGLGRTGSWFAGCETPLVPDIIATAKGLGAGYAAIGAVLCREDVYDALAAGSRRFTLGHTWDGAPLSCAVGLGVMDILRREGLVEHVRERGRRLRDELAAALADVPMVREVRGHGFLLGIEFVDPRDGHSFLPPELRVARQIDDGALRNGLVILSTQPTRDGYSGDQSLFAPAFTSTDDELAEMVARFARVVREVAAGVDRELGRTLPGAGASHAGSSSSEPSTAGLRALIIQHEDATPPGLVTTWLQEHGIAVDVFGIHEDPRQINVNEYALVVSLGSEFAAYDDSVPWLARERRLMADAIEADVPVLGICFGGQLLARVLGGETFRAQEAEIGWLPVRTAQPDVVPDGPWFQWHFDSFTAPPGATVLAESDVGPQAYRVGRNLGVQFHPEVTPEIMDTWVKVFRHELTAEGVDPDRLLDETQRTAEAHRARSLALLDLFLREIARLPAEPARR